MMQDLTRLQNPNVIETLDYETIFMHMKAELLRLDPSFSALLENDAARANLLAFAAKSKLDPIFTV